MRDRLDRTSPVPLYHQIAGALRNAIAVGELRPGARLPSVRDAAQAWGVNLHTVRKAYGALAGEGLVRVRGTRGTEVAAGGQGAPAADSLDAFLMRWLTVAREEFGLSQLQLGQLLVKRAAAGAQPSVHVIECSREQAEGHAQEVMRMWRVEAKPFVLAEASELPRGILVATYFHYNDIRQRWPNRLDEVRFVAIAPDSTIADRLPPRRRGVRRQRLLICELEESKAVNIAADLKNVFDESRYRIEPRVLATPGRLPRSGGGDVLLVSPRVWGALTERQRARVLQIRYCVHAHELESLGRSLGWQRASMAALA